MLRQEYIDKVNSKRFGEIIFSFVPEKINVRRDSVIIQCPIHGDVSVNAGGILYRDRECPECGNERGHRRHALGKDEITRRLLARGKDEYEYIDIPENIKFSKKIVIRHRFCGLTFEQDLNAHLRGQGCPRCWKINHGDSGCIGRDEILYRCKLSKNHKNIDYYKSILPDKVRVHDSAWFYCLDHGFFKQTVVNHMSVEQTCPKCGHTKAGLLTRLGKPGFLLKAETIHPAGRFDYFLVPETFKMTDKVKIKCNICGKIFEQAAGSHCQGIGCPHCGVPLSFWENDIYEFIFKELNFSDVVQKYRNWADDGRREIDILIPSLKYGFECNGVHWHASDTLSPSPKPMLYHKQKQDEALSKGIKLFYLWDDVPIEVNKAMVRKILSLNYLPEMEKNKNGIFYFNKDICPTKDMVSRDLSFVNEQMPEPTVRSYYRQERLTFGAGLWAFRE